MQCSQCHSKLLKVITYIIDNEYSKVSLHEPIFGANNDWVIQRKIET